MTGIERTYCVASEMIAANRWLNSLSDDVSEEILVSYWNPETKAQLDCSFVFITLQGNPTPQLRLFEDSWFALKELGLSFLEELANLDSHRLGRVAKPTEIIAALKKLGFANQGVGG